MIRGYVTSRAFGGLIVPVPAQNAALREYARSRGEIYVLPFLEHKFDGCYMQLFTTIKSARDGDCIAMYSAAMLPFNDKEKLRKLESIIRERNCEIHCVLEGATMPSLKKIDNVILSYRIREYLDQASTPDITSLRTMKV